MATSAAWRHAWRAPVFGALLLVVAGGVQAQEDEELEGAPPGMQEREPDAARETPIAEPPPAPEPPEPVPEGEPEAPAPIAAYVQGEGFRILSPDESFKLRIGLQSAYKFEPVFLGTESQIRRPFFVLRPIFSGHLVKPWIRFWTSLELAANPPFLLDSYLEIQPVDWFGLRLGQQFSPIDRHEYFGPQEILFPEWSRVADYFWPGRDKGVLLFGTFFEQKLEYYAGVFSGSPLRQLQVIPGNFMLKGRVTVSPLGPVGPTEFPYMLEEEPLPFRISFTGQAYGGRQNLAVENLNPSTGLFETVPTGDRRQNIGGGGDVALQVGPMAALVQGYVRNTDPLDGSPAFTSLGAWGQAGVEVWPERVDLGVRLSWLEPSLDLDNDNLFLGEIQAGYYLVAPTFVIRARYGIAYQQTPDEDAIGAVPLGAPVGLINLFTLQLNAMF